MARSATERKFRASRRKIAVTLPGRQNVRSIAADDQAGNQPHRRDLPDHLKNRPEAASYLGYLFLKGFLNKDFKPGDLHKQDEVAKDRYNAGVLYGQIVLKHLAAIESPRDTLPGGSGYPCTGDRQCGQDRSGPPCECRKRKKAYDEAFECMSGSHSAQVEVAHVAVHGKECRNLFYLLNGLDMLVGQLLTNHRKNA